ncbi:MAG: hypothetical protein ACI8PT_004341, partial [Gammaproteobacteria bacterium]
MIETGTVTSTVDGVRCCVHAILVEDWASAFHASTTGRLALRVSNQGGVVVGSAALALSASQQRDQHY